ncbi:class I SAM-dependent methyltransferase [Halodesulfurarchaeum sp. HSR-GB]|uniref:small ribosomal subunit Rsm22 family protein n=1 Tax=Halodesulfurarchaeum sp. HSR-GB TaxID=3074077 RepID=UPI002859C2C1|nr:class I SAM-dependent methyltransferase [Halodesulfurarchaeum sp. HSR-GB]MDR5657505.1 class I SAM-dependent methyltransferase [Halodesulfurarchaeum sp. HSR-GB]
MPVDRAAVRDTAKYLRQIRPIDPDEVSEYVPDQPDPRVVRQLLREMALELGIAEGPDGLFRPAATGPFKRPFDGVEGLPAAYDRQLEALLVEQYGPDWHRGDSGAAIRERIERLKADYFAGRSVSYDLDIALAYAIYHLADYYASTQYLLAELSREGLVPSQARILDVGAGVGGPALAITDYFDVPNREPDSLPVLDYQAVEPSTAADVLEALLGSGPRNVSVSIARETAEAFESSETYDLIFFNNVLSELENPVETAERYLDLLAPDGSLVLTAPADRNTSIQLREVERELETRGATVYGPTVRLWPNERPTEDCWSFDQQPDITVPGVQATLAEEADRAATVTNTSVKYSYSILRTDSERRYDLALSRSNVAMLGEMETHVGSRIDLVVAKLSRNLAEDGHPLYKISDGSESENHFAVLVNETELNQALRRAGYGDLLSVTNVLALYNDDEGAYNLVVDEETIVDA